MNTHNIRFSGEITTNIYLDMDMDVSKRLCNAADS